MDVGNFIPEFQLLVCFLLLHQLSVVEISDTLCHSVRVPVSLVLMHTCRKHVRMHCIHDVRPYTVQTCSTPGKCTLHTSTELALFFRYIVLSPPMWQTACMVSCYSELACWLVWNYHYHYTYCIIITDQIFSGIYPCMSCIALRPLIYIHMYNIYIHIYIYTDCFCRN